MNKGKKVCIVAAMDSLTVGEAAEYLDRSPSWIYKLITRKDPRLPWEKKGSIYLIDTESVRRFRHRRPGNPGKQKLESAQRNNRKNNLNKNRAAGGRALRARRG